MIARTGKYIQMANSGGIGRSGCTNSASRAFAWSMEQGKAVKPPSRKHAIVFDNPKIRDDMPWDATCFVVSSRLKRVFERELPNHAQFFPVLVEGEPRSGEPSYYFANWLHAVDCVDLKKSKYEILEDDASNQKEYDFTRIVIDPTRVPKDIYIFHPKLIGLQVAVDTAVRTLIKKEKLIGPQFYSFHNC